MSMKSICTAAMIFLSVSAVAGIEDAVAKPKQSAATAYTSTDPNSNADIEWLGEALANIYEYAKGNNENKDKWMHDALDRLMARYPEWSVALIASGLGPTRGCRHAHLEMPATFGTLRRRGFLR